LAPNTAGEADRVIRELRPDLVLMDISLRGTDGLTLTRHLKQDPALTGIPFVALSAYPMEQDEANAVNAGSAGFICKPINARAFAGQRFLTNFHMDSPSPMALCLVAQIELR